MELVPGTLSRQVSEDPRVEEGGESKSTEGEKAFEDFKGENEAWKPTSKPSKASKPSRAAKGPSKPSKLPLLKANVLSKEEKHTRTL